PTLLARVFDPNTRPVTGWTRLPNTEKTAGRRDLAPSATGGATAFLRTRFSPFALAMIAHDRTTVGNFALHACGRFRKRDFQIVTQISPALRPPAASSAAAEKLFKDAAASAASAAAKDFPENVERIVKPAGSRTRA